MFAHLLFTALSFELAFGCMRSPTISRPVSFVCASEAFLVLGFIVVLLLLSLVLWHQRSSTVSGTSETCAAVAVAIASALGFFLPFAFSFVETGIFSVNISVLF